MKASKSPLFQWDVNQTFIDCQGSYVEYIINNDVYRVEVNDGVCMIPDEFFQAGGMKKVYEVYADGTIRDHNIYVEGRPQPPDYIFTPTERTTFDSLVERVDNAVADMYAKAEAGEFDGRDGVDGKDGVDGADGADGADGYSPTATVERTTDGAVITITDKDGTTTAEVYDGVSKEYVDGQIEVVQGEIEATADKLDVLWKLSKGIIYEWQKTEVDGVVTVPSGAKSSVLQGLKGKSVVWNQLVENGNFEDTTGWSTYGGTIATSNNVCTFTASNAVVNTSRLQTNLATVTGHKYYTTVSFKSSKATSAYVTTDGNSPLVLITNIQEDTFTTLQFVSNAAVANGTLLRIYLNAGGEIVEGDTIEISNVMVLDLTLMFGAGNEPTLAQFKTLFPNDYYPYSEPTLKSVSVSKFTVNSTDYPIVFVGKNAGTARDEIDLINKKYIQRVGSRPYESGDEDNPSVITDMTTTYYELATPIETDITQEEITAITASGDTIVFDGDIEVGSVFNHFIALNEVNV